MLTRTARPPRARSFAAFCTAALAAAALAVLPALPATAEEADPVAAAAEARAAADAAHATAADAAAAADVAATAATDARSAANVAAEALAAAEALLGADTENPLLQEALAAAAAAFSTADGIAIAAEAAAAAAADAASAAKVNADALEALAQEAEAALEGDPAPPAEEVSEETIVPEGDAAAKKGNENCDVNLMTEQTADRFVHCWPEPDVDIELDSVCPTMITVYVSNLWGWQWWDYTIEVNDEPVVVELDKWGNGQFTVTDFESGHLVVKVYKGDWKVAWDHKEIKSYCPEIETEVEHACNVIGGKAEVEVRVSDLIKWRDYEITITGPDGFEEYYETDWDEYWEYDFWLYPGEYTVTVESDGGERLPDLGPVVYTFTVAPCPGEVVITITPTCATNNSGSLGASLSGLIPGREYWVTVEGANGFVTDVTFVATESTWAVPPAHLPPGTYTVTVVDTASSSWAPDLTLESKTVYEPEYDPLTWSATGTITACPALASTGTGPSAQLAPALALIPLGGGLLLAGALRNRRQPLMEEES